MTRLIVFGVLSILAFSQANISSRIVGGETSTTGQNPHQISLRRNDAHSCGGSIISPTVIVTAAHCVDGANVTRLSVRAGSNHRFSGGVLINVAKYIMHENYANLENDVALLFLERPLVYSKKIQPIKLASKPCLSELPLILSGWGRVSEGGDVPQYLQHVTLKTIPEQECISVTDRKGVLCVAHSRGGLGSCNGDSGGPALQNNELAGICSFKIGECGTENPDGYTDVYHFRKWIMKNAGL